VSCTPLLTAVCSKTVAARCFHIVAAFCSPPDSNALLLVLQCKSGTYALSCPELTTLHLQWSQERKSKFCFSLEMRLLQWAVSPVTPWNRFFLKKRKSHFRNLEVHRRVTTVRYLSLPWSRSINFTSCKLISSRSILILFSHTCIRLLSVIFPKVFPSKTCTHLRPSSHCVPHAPPIFICLQRIIFFQEYKSWSSS
jgi:hypothetical protein